jgi:hypothetical protein
MLFSTILAVKNDKGTAKFRNTAYIYIRRITYQTEANILAVSQFMISYSFTIYSFIDVLFNRAFLNYISLKGKWIASKRKKAYMIYFNASSKYLTGRIEENNDRSHSGLPVLGRDF